jgi:hypothetical protein
MDTTLAFITLLSLMVAAVMSLVSWRLVRDERVRSAARIAALAEEIHGGRGVEDLPLKADAGRAVPLGNDMFAQPGAEGRSRFALAASIVLVLGTIGSIAVVLGVVGAPNRQPAAERAPFAASDARTPAAAAAAPLELMALGHERDADGLVVRGVLRNPSNGSELDSLTAVVLLFNRDGGLITSGRAAVEAARLEPGGETRFVVTVPSAPDVERYRVSFTSDEHVVPHVDHRS